MSIESRYPNLCRDMLLAKRYQHPTAEPPLCLSGASDGADEHFGAAACSAGHLVAHIMGPQNVPSELCASTQAEALYPVSDELLSDASITAALQKTIVERAGAASRMTGTIEGSRRNYLQVHCAEACVCVCYRLKPSPERRSQLDVGGGAGWAAQWYLDRFQPAGPEDPSECRLYLWDDGLPAASDCLIDPATHRRWSRWHGGRWQPLADGEAPPLGQFQLYAGIGATRLSDDGVAAIRALYSDHEASAPRA